MSNDLDENIPEQKSNNSTPEESGGQGEKFFTQDEVNRIVADRLARERAKNQPSEADIKLLEAEAKLKEATEKERRIECREYLVANNFPVGLEYFLDTSSLPAFKDAVKGVLSVFNSTEREHQDPPKAPLTGERLLRTAFGLRRKD